MLDRTTDAGEFVSATYGWYLARNVNMAPERARECMRRSGYEVKTPMERVLRPKARMHLSHAQRKSGLPIFEEITRPLWPRYELIRFDLADGRWHDLFAAIGILGLIGDAATQLPYRFPEASYRALEACEVDGAIPGSTTVREIFFQIGEAVRIDDGPFTGFEGEIAELPNIALAELDDSMKVKLLVAMFGARVPVELPIGSIRKIGVAA